MDYICFGIAFIIILITAGFAYKNRYNTKAWISVLTFGALFTVFFMVLPTDWPEAENSVIKPLYSVVSAMLYSLKTISGRQDITQLQSIGLEGVLKYIYFFINYALFFIIPVLGSALILSFVGDALSGIFYLIPYSRKTIIFSELNKNSILFAKGLKNNSKRTKIVFCNTKNCSRSLIEEARKLHAITLHSSCESIRLHKTDNEIYLMNEDENKNSDFARKLTNKYASKNIPVTLNVFISSNPAITLLEDNINTFNANNKKSGSKDNIIKPLINVRFIDKTKLFCDNLLFSEPLFNTPENTKNISVMIIGCGETGINMLKSVTWYGQLYGYSLEIKVYDKNADKIKGTFDQQCPELNPAFGYNIEFINVDAATADFERIITKENHQAERATAAYIFTGDNEKNIAVADSLYCIFRRSRNFRNTPKIFTWTQSSDNVDYMLDKNNSFLAKRNIHIIANIEKLYSENILFQTKIENLALATHICYNEALHLKKDSREYRKILNGFYNSNYNRRSSMSTAIHFEAKLHLFENLLNEYSINYTKENIESLYKEIISDNNHPITLKLAECEHNRWSAYIRSEGYRFADTDTMAQFVPFAKTNKDTLSKLHPCITDFNSLDEVEEKYNILAEKYNLDKKNFKKYDYLIIKEIFNIRKLAEELQQS